MIRSAVVAGAALIRRCRGGENFAADGTLGAAVRRPVVRLEFVLIFRGLLLTSHRRVVFLYSRRFSWRWLYQFRRAAAASQWGGLGL